MNKLILAAIRCSLMFLLPAGAYAISAQWDLDPISGDWNTAANWTPNGVPNGPADIATFGLSHTANISISERTEVNAIIFTQGASAYTITNSNLTQSSGPLILSGTGIVNNSGTIQTFVMQAGSGSFSGGGDIIFTNTATAGSSTVFINNVPDGIVGGVTGGGTGFLGHSNAGYGTFINKGGTLGNGGIGGSTSVTDSASADHGTFINEGASFANGGSTSIGGTGGQVATAANGTFINNGGLANGARGGSTQLNPGATADHGTFINNGGTVSGASGGFTEIIAATASDGTFINNGGVASGAAGGFTRFTTDSTAASATLIANGGTGGGQGGTIFFIGNSTGGTPRVEVFGNGSLDISALYGPRLTIGSVEGDGNVFLGDNNLTVGSNDLSTTFSGVIQDGGQNGSTGGSVTKIGSGTLVLSGANTYTDDTHINRGVLKIDGSINSNTFVHHTGTLAGTGTVHGNITNGGTVSPGDPVGTWTVSNYTQAQYATLMIQIAGASAGEFGVLNVLGTANLSGHLGPVLLNGFVPTIGETFTFLHYGAVTGTLFIFNRNIDNVPEHWEVSYFPTYAILTVAPGNVSVPDQGSTFLLLTLGLLGLVAYRQNAGDNGDTMGNQKAARRRYFLRNHENES